MINVTATHLRTIARECSEPELCAAAINAAASEFNINTGYRIAAFLAHVAVESAGFNRVRENMNYTTPERLLAIFPSHFKSIAEATPYLHNPIALANFVYANRLGNGSVQSGDGYRFRGGGWIQTTGRLNFGITGSAIGVPLGDKPQMIEDLLVSARSAGYYWASHGLNELADGIPGVPEDEDFLKETKIITGGKTGLAERQAKFKLALPLFT